MQEKISVIVPVYNGEKSIKRCILSVLKQTYREFELLIVEDGSTDRTVEIVEKCIDTDERIRLIKGTHKGVSAARNIGLEKAQGKYIAFVDADDEIMPDYLEILYGILRDNCAKIAVCGLMHAKTERSMIPQLLLQRKETFRVRRYNGRQFLRRMEEPLRYELTTVCWNKLYKREIFEGKKYPEGRIYEDSALMQDVLYPAVRIAETDAKLYVYHTETEGITRIAYGKQHLAEVIYAGKRMNFFKGRRDYFLYALARKQYCICLLKHYYLVYKNDASKDMILVKLREQQKRYLKGFAWKRTLSLPIQLIFTLGLYFPYICGAFIVYWDKLLEKSGRERM